MIDHKSVSKKSIKSIAIYSTICVSVILIVLFLDNYEMFLKPEYTLQDLRFRIRGVESHNESVVIVGLDPQSLEMLGLLKEKTEQ